MLILRERLISCFTYLYIPYLTEPTTRACQDNATPTKWRRTWPEPDQPTLMLDDSIFFTYLFFQLDSKHTGTKDGVLLFYITLQQAELML